MLDRIRSAWNALRGYSAAADLRASSWSPSAGSANAEVAGAAATVARRARDAVRNDPYAARIVDLWTANAVGAGITTRWPDATHSALWRRWAESTACDAEGRLELYGLQALVMRAVVESGECFVRMLPAEITPANPIGLRLQVLESDHLDTSRQGVIEGIPTLQGIGLGEAGEPVGYWLHRVHPGASWILPGGGGLIVTLTAMVDLWVAIGPEPDPRQAPRRWLRAGIARSFEASGGLRIAWCSAEPDTPPVSRRKARQVVEVPA